MKSDSLVFRPVRACDGQDAAEVERICFPPNEACTAKIMEQRVRICADAFLTVWDDDRMIGFIDGLATDEEHLRDEFYRDASLHDSNGRNVMIMGLDVLPEYRGQGIASALMKEYTAMQKRAGRQRLVLTCLADKIPMYAHMGFRNLGVSDSLWGNEQWYEMDMDIKENTMTYCENTEYMLGVTKDLLAIDSPTGFTAKATEFSVREFEKLGFRASVTRKGSVLAEIGGEGNPLIVTAHLDTLGGIVSEVKANGRLKISNLGGMRPVNCETENVRVYTRKGTVVEGCMQLLNPSTHVNPKMADTPRNFDTMEIVLDEDVHSKEDTLALGITNGCFVCFDPRTRITDSGYIKSRYLDDKLAAAVLFAFAKKVSENSIQLNRKVYLFLTTYEEVGHGGKGGLPEDAEEILAVDMGCVGDGLEGSERKVSICAKDAHGPYDYDVTAKLVSLAADNGLQYAVDVYLNYSSDAQAAIAAGHDFRHALIGPGVYASHGYERSHVEGAENTLRLLELYLGKE